MHARARLSLAAAALPLAALSLTACGGSEEDTTASESETSAPAETESETPEETESAEDGAGDGDTPAWATPVNTDGEVISTFDIGDLSVEVHQVGVEKATETGFFVDPETNEPVVAEGDDIVFVNYVITNNGDDIDLGASIVSIDARYDSWPYVQGMDGTTDSEQFESLGLDDDAIAEIADPAIYTLGAGQTINFAENFGYEKGGKITFGGDATPVDDEAELLSDEGVEGEGTGTTP